MNRLRHIIGALLIVFTFTARAADTSTFITVADIHFDPFGSCHRTQKPCPLITKLRAADVNQWPRLLLEYQSKKISGYRNDTNYALLQSAVSELKLVAMQKNPKFVILLGDFLSHDFKEHYQKYAGDKSLKEYPAFVKKTLQFLTQNITQAFPKVDVYAAVGNNDSYLGDYAIAPNSAFYKDTAQTWQVFMHDSQNKQAFLKDFPTAGYYAVTPKKEPKLRILVLNTVLFSPRAFGEDLSHAAHAELHWLRGQLFDATQHKQKVLLAFHVPLGIDAYATIKKLSIQPFWQAEYTNQFLTQLNGADNLVAILAAHTHMDWFQLITFAHNNKRIESLTPAISPIFGNNPGFKVFQYDPATLTLQNFKTYFLPINQRTMPKWQQEYDFNATYQKACQSCTLVQGMAQLAKDNEQAKTYRKYYAVSTHSQPITVEGNWVPYYWCAVVAATTEQYQQCEAEKV